MCLSPFYIETISNRSQPVKCGKCPECIKQRAMQWSFRLMEEEREAQSSIFLTLTYAPGHSTITNNGFLSLNKGHLQGFFKRLRMQQCRCLLPGSHKKHRCTYSKFRNAHIKYYAVGEYGGRFGRPHYHIILFNADIELIEKAWYGHYQQWRATKYKGRLKKHADCAVIDRIKTSMPIGQIYCGSVNGASVGYTMKYLSKLGTIPVHKNDDRLKEFSLMSKGLGVSYLKNNMVAWHRQDILDRSYVTTQDGVKIGMPRYLKEKIYTEAERKRNAIIYSYKLEKEIEEMMNTTDHYWHKKVQSDLFAFARMRYEAELNTSIE